jgi:MFS family permease
VDGTLGIILGIILWGIGMGAQESILKAVIATMVSKEKRATAYGVFYTVFGSAWALGSLLIGVLYEVNLLYVVVFSMAMELVALITLLIYRNRLLLQPND